MAFFLLLRKDLNDPRQATEPRAKREAMSALCHDLVVDSTFERSENIGEFELACSEGCGLHHRKALPFICACALY